MQYVINSNQIKEKLEKKKSKKEYDVFLSHNSKDKDEVKKISDQLEKLGVLPWMDTRDLHPGNNIIEEIQKNIQNIRTAAVFIGKDGVGPWQNIEWQTYFHLLQEKKANIIPVILPNVDDEPKLPPFLQPFRRVFFNKSYPYGLDELYRGITEGKDVVSRPVVLLTASATLQKVKATVRKYLEEEIIEVLPHKPYPPSEEEFKSRLCDDLKKCDVFVQLLSDCPDEDLPNRASIAYRCAKELGKVVLQWHEADINISQIENIEHRELLARKEISSEEINSFKYKIVEKLNKQETIGTDRPRIKLFIHRDPIDKDMMNAIIKSLEDKLIEKPMILWPSASDDNVDGPVELSRYLKANISDCDALIVLYGQCEASWVQYQYNQCFDIIANSGKRLKVWALYCSAQPDVEEKIRGLGLRPENLEIIVINGSSDEDMQKFIDRLL